MRAPTWRHPLLLSILFSSVAALAAEPMLMAPRVPPEHREAARGLSSPLSPSPEIVARGKTLYEGKGGCLNCHGERGDGKGPAAAALTPAPRNFHHRGFWRHRSDGEIFWVIKYGIPGTAMIESGPVLSDEDIWSVLEYVRTFAGDGGPEGSGMRHGSPRMGERPCCGDDGR